MSVGGTQAYEGTADLPPAVISALGLARSQGFDCSCRPEQGRLLRLLAAGRRGGLIGETGAGCGVGLSWLLTGAGPGTRLVSVERDPGRAAACAGLFAGQPNVTVRCADWSALLADGPFDLLVLDGGGSGKGGRQQPADVSQALTFGGMIVIDDFTPLSGWPPRHQGRPDDIRRHWLEHPALLATEIRLAPDLSAVVGVRIR